ncbi:hypothetical protein [Deinococcus xianganensis]|uniref:Uncharacterized protein n=1 Tax=Deinococcus xianganensis TaxID=1507289 RepID=A0A6I4YN89_9DEIO|nr:hypothetical protein [Deinococcus xianganensis]MXV21274.1 hypothetical protein [Deinococcus xianganensis]
MIPLPGCCHDCIQHGKRVPQTFGPEYAEYRACKYFRQRDFSGKATAHGSTLYTHPDAGCRDHKPRTLNPRPLRPGGASPSPDKRD